MSRKLTTDEFIERAKKVHGSKYDYSKVEYKDGRTKVCIICPIHGEFWQNPFSHLNGIGCRKCSYEKNALNASKSINEFIAKAKEIHGDKYDYSKVEYKSNRIKVCIICPNHGEFWQSPNNHILQRHGCPKCATRGLRLSEDEFISRLKKIHGDSYDYSKVKYVNMHTKVCVICPKHGEFNMRPYALLHGHKCPKCSHKSNAYTTEEWITEAKKIHGDRYDYSKVEYSNNHTKVCIICPKHGEFWQIPLGHLKGKGCPTCNESHLEKETRILLSKQKIEYVNSKRFNWLNKQHLDFYLPKYKVAIECQGIQHFKPIIHFGGKENLKRTQILDSKKKKLCEENGITLYYIDYDEDVETKLNEILEEICHST